MQKKLCSGWNTWNTNSVLSHVYLPEGFAINLAFKNSGTGYPYINDFYKANRILKRPENITLGKRSDDGRYTELLVEWMAEPWRKNSRCSIKVQTAAIDRDLLMLITVYEREPLRSPHLIIETGVLWNRPNGHITKKENVIQAAFPAGTWKIGTTAPLVHDPFVTSNAPYLPVALDGEIGIYTGKARSLEDIKNIMAERSAEVDSMHTMYGELAEPFRAMQTILAWNVIYDPENNRAISPVSRLWSTTWGGYVLFDWDTYFASLMYSLYNKELAYANLVEVTRGITPSGFIPNSQSAYGILSVDRSQPPVGSLTALMIYEKYKEKWMLEEVYPGLLKWNRWWPEHRDTGGYLCWGSDSISNLVDGTFNNWQAAAFESGLDNSPMFDDIPFNRETCKLELADVGLMGFYIADCKALAKISEILGKTAESSELLSRAGQYASSLETLWDPKTALYLNKRTDNGALQHRLSPTHFYPLLAGVPTQERAKEMIDRHFFNEEEFMGEWIIPSIARNDPAFGDQHYWRGRIWAPMNLLVYLGLRNYDLPEARKVLVDKSLALMMKSWEAEGAIYENYHTVLGTGNDITSSDGFYHWGALLGFISFIEKGY
jgi:hypothetical protein